MPMDGQGLHRDFIHLIQIAVLPIYRVTNSKGYQMGEDLGRYRPSTTTQMSLKKADNVAAWGRGFKNNEYWRNNWALLYGKLTFRCLQNSSKSFRMQV